MNTILLILTTLILSAVFLLIIRLWLNKIEEKTKSFEGFIELFKDLSRRVDASSNQFAQLQKTIGEFSEIGRSMQELQEFLTSPKLRGNIGEQVLRELLSQYFPKQSYSLQYTFKNGEKVDAVIKTSQGLIPIDSKFPMENFRRIIQEDNPQLKEKAKKEFTSDVKKHIQDIAKKYVLVNEGTVDYALMYIPSEAVYYEIINDSYLFDFAGEKRVLPVSPMSFYAYMKAILMSFEGQRIQTKAKEILSILQAIRKDYEKTDEALSILIKHVTNAYNQAMQVTKNFLQLGQKLTSTQFLSSGDNNQERLIE